MTALPDPATLTELSRAVRCDRAPSCDCGLVEACPPKLEPIVAAARREAETTPSLKAANAQCVKLLDERTALKARLVEAERLLEKAGRHEPGCTVRWGTYCGCMDRQESERREFLSKEASNG